MSKYNVINTQSFAIEELTASEQESICGANAEAWTRCTASVSGGSSFFVAPAAAFCGYGWLIASVVQ